MITRSFAYYYAGLVVTDLAAARSFYTDLHGFSHIRSGDGGDPRGFKVGHYV